MKSSKLICLAMTIACIYALLPQMAVQVYGESIRGSVEKVLENLYIDENGVLIRYHGSAEEVVIPYGVKSIGAGAFKSCSSLVSITIPDSVTRIEDEAFMSCRRLTEITIPAGVTRIGDKAFQFCSGLTEITIPDDVTSIGYGAFDGCNDLESVTIPNGVTCIGDGAFKDSNLKSIEIPDSVTNIGEDAFEDCENLTIYGTKNSYAQEYAWKNNIPFFEITEHLPEIKNLSGYLIAVPPEHPLFLRAMSQVLFFKRDSRKEIPVPAVQIYEEFLAGERKVGKTGIYDLITSTYYPDRRYGASYALVDSTGDGIPELHTQSGHGYIIYSCKDNEMFELETYTGSYVLLNDGALFLSSVSEGWASYQYFELDDSGNHISELSFSWRDYNQNNLRDDEEFEFDGDSCTKEEWIARTREYLFTDEDGREQIRNQAEWTTYCEEIR